MEALRRSGMLRLGAFRPTLGLRVLRPHPQPSPCGRGWPRSAGPGEGVSTVRLRQRVTELFLPETWRCPPDLSSRRRPTGAWTAACLGAHERPGPGPAHRYFRASRQLGAFVKSGRKYVLSSVNRPIATSPKYRAKRLKRQVDWLVNGRLTGPIFSRALTY